MPINEAIEFWTIKNWIELTEQACVAYHKGSSLSWAVLVFGRTLTMPHKEEIIQVFIANATIAYLQKLLISSSFLDKSEA